MIIRQSQSSPFIEPRGGSKMKTHGKFLHWLPVALGIGLPLACAAADLPLIKIIATGGTIATVYDAQKGGWVPALKGEDLVKGLPELQKLARVEVEEMPPDISFSDSTVEHWVAVSRRMNALCSDPAVSGIVITEGTDAMDEAAFFMDLTSTCKKPVVATGSLRGGTHPWSDGPSNLLNAVRVAS